jgi:hypothetical protein
VDLFDLLKVLPLASAVTWFALAGFQVYRDRIHTWTETFFLFACIFAGLYAVSDWLFFTAETKGFAQLAAIASLTSVIVTALFLLLFTLVYIDRMRRVYWSFAVVSGGVLILVWLFGLQDVSCSTGPGLGVCSQGLWLPAYNIPVFLVLLAYFGAYSFGGTVNIYRLHKIVRDSSPNLARRTRGFLIVFILVLVFGLGTNGTFGAIQSQVPPPFSTLLLVIAGATIYTLYPGSRQRISEAVRRFQARRYSIKAALVTYMDGTLVGARSRPGETTIDQDIFGATLDVIQNFMRTSFPILRGRSLSSISHGDYTLVVERGRHTYLTVVLEGEETDQLRRQMRDLLLDFEEENRSVLEQWRGIPEEAHGMEKMLSSLFEESPLF